MKSGTDYTDRSLHQEDDKRNKWKDAVCGCCKRADSTEGLGSCSPEKPSLNQICPVVTRFNMIKPGDTRLPRKLNSGPINQESFQLAQDDVRNEHSSSLDRPFTRQGRRYGQEQVP